MTRSKLVVTWKVRRCALFLGFPSGCTGSPGVVVVGYLAIEFSSCAKKKEK